jgi:Predicted solute binding protein
MAWFNTSYLKKKKLTIDHSKVSTADQSSFPMPVAGTDADLKVTGSGGQVQNSSGFDIIFVDSTETTQLDHEIEKYVSTTGEIEMWVRIPTASHTTDTVIYMYFNNSSISTSQENVTGVWDSNFKGVWHHNDNAANTTVKDSTSNAHNGTNQANTSTKTTTGEIDGALTFNGTTDYVNANTTASSLGTGNLTISGWFKPTSTFNTSSSADMSIVSLSDSPSSNDAMVRLLKSDGKLHFSISDGSVERDATSTETSWTGGTWYHFFAIFSTTTGSTLYVTGAADGTNANTTRGSTQSAELDIGRQWVGKNFNGAIDEVHVSNIARTTGWGVTEYNSQSSPSTFYSTGAMQSQRVIPSTAALLQVGTRTVTSTAALLQTSTRTITSTAALLQTNTRTITSTAALDTGATTSSRTIPSTAALLQTSTRTITSTAALLQTNARTIPSTSALLQIGTRTIPSTAALLQTNTRPITSTAALLQRNTRTISSSTALLQTNSRTIPSSVSLGSSRVIPSTAALLQRSSRTIFSSAALDSAAPAATPTVYAQLLYLQTSQLITASGNSGPLTVGNLGEISLDINITSNQGTSPTIQFYIERLGSDGVYYPIYDSTSISVAPTVKCVSTGAGLGSAASFAGTIRVRWVIGGSAGPGWIYSLSLVGK